MNSGSELFLFAGPEMGHLLAEVELGRRLTSINPQISILILIPKLPIPNENLDNFIKTLNADLIRDPNQRIYLIELPSPGDVSPELTLPHMHVQLTDHLANLYKPIVKTTVEDRRRMRPTAGIVFDMFCSPMVDVAEELGVPSYLFYTSGANMLTVTLKMESLVRPEDLPAVFEGLSPESTPINFQGFKNPVPLKVYPHALVNKELRMSHLFMRFARQYRRAKGILVNTFFELDSDLLKVLNDDESVPPVYSVGPILNLPSDNGGLLEPPRDPILSWLDEQPAGSVVFVCFGSKIKSFEKAQVEHLAAGIEQSGHRFLWSIRAPSNDVFPEGFSERVAERGKVIGWAPQTKVLGHVAIGAFVSHCGWNSTLESIWFGVPIVAWPMYAEQQLNAFGLVTELGLAVELKMDYVYSFMTGKGSVMIKAAEVEAAIRKVMEEEDGIKVRKKIKEMSELARKAMDVGESSYASLSLYIESVMKN